MGAHHPWTPNYFIKETLIALATFGYGNAVVDANLEYLELFNRFEDILALVLPPTLGFEKISVRIPEVVLQTKSGQFSLDAVSGGVASIIDIAWQILMYSPGDEEFVVTIDEPENHLHPELQRTFLPSLLKAFPNVQFVAASHN
jgi:predicted ATPase